MGRVGRVILVASPLLGPATWEPVANALRRSGRTVTVAAVSGPVGAPDDVLAGLLDTVPDEPGLVLVPHSNAGLYVAALAAARPVDRIVFVDAGLPSDAPSTPVAPAGLRAHLSGLVGADGRLPPWTQWWPEAEVARLFPDDVSRARVEAEQSRLPLAYFDAEVPTDSGWTSARTAYLAFGDTYAEERAMAVERGWPVETLAGEHLHLLVDPVGVAAAICRLAGDRSDVQSSPTKQAEPG